MKVTEPPVTCKGLELMKVTEPPVTCKGLELMKVTEPPVTCKELAYLILHLSVIQGNLVFETEAEHWKYPYFCANTRIHNFMGVSFIPL